MDYQWDKKKAASNFTKHGIRFSDAVSVFQDDRALSREELSGHEDRFIILGADAFLRLLVVVFTFRGESIRIISARKATKREIEQYRGAV